MAKRQNFVVGSTNAVTETMTTSELNHGFDRYEVLTADKLDGTLNSVSDYSNDSSNEIANAIQSITGAQPTGATQTELANALQQMRNEIETTSLTFKGYVATSAPSSSTYALVEGNLWINSATMPTSFPVAASSIKQWNGTSWVNYGSTYTPADFDFFRNINDNEGYYWFGGLWTVMSTDMDTTYFELNPSGKWTFNDTTKNISNWSSNVTNCIAEIPQDINLELNGGVLTLKAGSKLYKPNGAGVFDTVTIASDISSNSFSGSVTRFVFIDINNNIINAASAVFSGTTAPTLSGTGFWYDTTNNVIKRTTDSGATWTTGYSFPIAIVTSVSDVATSIDQVFNGIGYIGSTVFAPGVKGLIPDGRNADGTLKSVSLSVSTVRTFSANLTGAFCVVVGANDMVYVGSAGWKYDASANINTDYGTKKLAIKLADVTLNSGVVTSFEPVQAFHAVDYSDIRTILGLVYPVGSLYLTIQNTVTCPLAAAMPGTSWVLETSGYALWTGDGTNGGNTIAAGAPDISGTITFVDDSSSTGTNTIVSASEDVPSTYAGTTSSSRFLARQKTISASSVNSIYGNSATIQPPAYVVNVWRRTA